MLLALSVVSACGETGPKTGTNTNWLLDCDTDEVCGSEGSCLCGLCTVRCETSDACGERGGSCASALATAAQCGAARTDAICLADCSEDADCRNEQRCITGRCAQVTTEGGCSGASEELACATFDDASLDGWTAAVDAAATLDVIPTPAFEGEGALRSSWPGRAIAERSFEPLVSGSVFGRFWLKLDAESARAHAAQLDGDSDETAFRLVTEGTRAWVETTTGVVAGESTALSAASWHCVRFAVVLSDTQGSLQVWLDETRFVNAQDLDTLPEGGVTGFQVGVGWANGTTTLYADYVRLSTEPVSCL
jgi:hypothetical protein